MRIKDIKEKRIKRRKLEKAIAAINVLLVRSIFLAATLSYYLKMEFPPYSLHFIVAFLMTVMLFWISAREWVLGSGF